MSDPVSGNFTATEWLQTPSSRGGCCSYAAGVFYYDTSGELAPFDTATKYKIRWSKDAFERGWVTGVDTASIQFQWSEWSNDGETSSFTELQYVIPDPFAGGGASFETPFYDKPSSSDFEVVYGTTIGLRPSILYQIGTGSISNTGWLSEPEIDPISFEEAAPTYQDHRDYFTENTPHLKRRIRFQFSSITDVLVAYFGSPPSYPFTIEYRYRSIDLEGEVVTDQIRSFSLTNTLEDGTSMLVIEPPPHSGRAYLSDFRTLYSARTVLPQITYLTPCIDLNLD